MKVFCDTNVLIAAFDARHVHHNAARPVLERVLQAKDEGFVAAHSLAETYAAITRLPGGSAVAPAHAWQLINENVLKHFSIVSLSAAEYAATIEKAATDGIEGGKTYDLILLRAAEKSGASRIFTFNVSHFQQLADHALRSKIVSP